MADDGGEVGRLMVTNCSDGETNMVNRQAAVLTVAGG